VGGAHDVGSGEVRIVSPIARQESREMVARTEGNYVVPAAASANGNGDGPRTDWIDYRASVARIHKREQNGDEPLTCPGCGTETDVSDVVHSPRCTHITAAVTQRPAAEWDEASVIAALQTYAAEHDGFPPPTAEWNKTAPDHPTYGVVVRLFGSWADAVRAAGIEPLEPGATRSGRRAPARPVAAAPAETKPRKKKWTLDAIIAAIVRWNAEHGAPPKSTAWQKKIDGYPSTSTVVAFFGAWSDGLEAAGLQPRERGAQPGNTNKTGRGQEPPVVWAVKVPGTGLRYRTADEALIAADEIEHDGERVARQARVDGQEGKADQAIDASRELAEKIRAACNSHAETIQPGSETPVAEAAERVEQDAESIPAAPEEREETAPEPSRSSDAEIVVAAVRELDPLSLTGEQTAGWIARLEAESERLHRRAQAFDTIAEGLRQLQETER
jgi:hypothetical protein